MTGAFLPNLTMTDGGLLAVKIAFVAILIGIAAFNRFVVMARYDIRTLGQTIRAEQVLFALILLAVSMFGALASST